MRRKKRGQNIVSTTFRGNSGKKIYTVIAHKSSPNAKNIKFIKKHGSTNRKNSETYVSGGCSYNY